MTKKKPKRKRSKAYKKKHREDSRRHYRENKNEIQGKRYFGYSVKELEKLLSLGYLRVSSKGFRLTKKGREMLKSLKHFGGKT